MPQAGVKYSEIRAIDPTAPPVVIDIAGNLENKKAFKLSDIASSVRYIILQQPPDTKFTSISDMVSDDEHIFINSLEGLFCYSTEGQYLYTVCANQLESIDFWGSGKTSGTCVVSGVFNNIDLLNGRLIYRTRHFPSLEEGDPDLRLNVFDIKELDAQMRFNSNINELKNFNPQPKYQRRLNPKKDIGLLSQFLLMDDLSLFFSNSLTSVAIYGDTLCKFNNYAQPVIDAIGARRGVYVGVPSNSYRINGEIMLLLGHNDTVFRVTPPNRLTPAYVMNWGKFRPDISEHVAGSALDGKFVFSNLFETSRFIFIHYTEGRDYPARRKEGKVKDHWAIFNKTAKTLTHHLPSDEFIMFENNLEPVGIPFWLKGVNHKDEMYMTFSKKRIEDYIATGRYQNDKLQAIYDRMPDDAICIMIVK